MQPTLTDSEILAEFFQTGNISAGDDQVMNVRNGLEEEPMKCPRNLSSYLHWRFFKKLSWFSFDGEAVQADCLKIERNIDKRFAKNKKQATIKDSFKLQYQYGVQIHTFKSSNTFFVFVYSICAIFIPSVIRIFAILNKISGLLRARNNERLLYNILKNSDTTFIQNIEVNQVVDLRVNNISEHI